MSVDLVEGHDVGLEALEDRAGLLGGAGMGLVDRSRRRWPSAMKASLICDEQLAGDVVGGVEQLVGGLRRGGEGQGAEAECRREEEGEFHGRDGLQCVDEWSSAPG